MKNNDNGNQSVVKSKSKNNFKNDSNLSFSTKQSSSNTFMNKRKMTRHYFLTSNLTKTTESWKRKIKNKENVSKNKNSNKLYKNGSQKNLEVKKQRNRSICNDLTANTIMKSPK